MPALLSHPVDPRLIQARHTLLIATLVLATPAAFGQSQVLAWGDSAYGQCALPPPIDDQVYSKIVAGDRHTLAVRLDGQIDTWGDNTYGQLNVPPLPPGIRYVDIVSGPFHGLGLRSDGTAIGWGENSAGQCTVPSLPPGIAYVQLAAGRDYSLGVRTDGQVAGWGANFYGETTVPPLTGAVEVAAGYGHSLARLSNGSIVGWGYNNIGQASPPPGQYTHVSTGAVHGAAIRSDGSITTWGANQFGQCNVPPLPPGRAYIDVVCGDFHTLALRSDGQVIAVGYNSRGQCNVPPIPSGFRFVQVDGSQYHSVARVEGPCGPNLCPPGIPFCFGDAADPNVSTPCPCGNFGAGGRGCANSFNPQGAVLTSSGLVSLDAAILEASGTPASSLCIYLQGDALDDVVFGDGVRCAGGYLTRLWPKINVAGTSSFPDGTEGYTLSQRGSVIRGSGVTRYYQTYYRNAAAAYCPPAQFNVTNGVSIIW